MAAPVRWVRGLEPNQRLLGPEPSVLPLNYPGAALSVSTPNSMLLSITTTYRPATDLGYLLHKNPARSHELELAFGRAHMFYPEASDECCTFALLLDWWSRPSSCSASFQRCRSNSLSRSLISPWAHARPCTSPHAGFSDPWIPSRAVVGPTAP